jgi:hypothetical protein
VRRIRAAGAGSAPVDVAAIGATVIVRTPDGRRTTSFVDGGNGHTGRRSHDVHLGLGDIDAAARLDARVVWRDAEGLHQDDLVLSPGRHTVVVGEARR